MIREEIDPNIILLVAAAILHKGKILVIMEEDEPYHGGWVLPQGYVRKGERLQEAAVREVKEELGIDIVITGLVGVYEDFLYEKQETKHYVIVCYSGVTLDDSQVKPTPEAINSALIDPSKPFTAAPAVIQNILKDVSNLKRSKIFSYKGKKSGYTIKFGGRS